MTASWNEGSANAPGSEGLGSAAQPGDVTWNYRELGGAAWATPGGDMAVASSALADINGVGLVSFSGPGLVADAQLWLAAPAVNFGWGLQGVEYLTQTANRFVSRTSPVAASRPAMIITFTPVPEPAAALWMIPALLTLVIRRR